MLMSGHYDAECASLSLAILRSFFVCVFYFSHIFSRRTRDPHQFYIRPFRLLTCLLLRLGTECLLISVQCLKQAVHIINIRLWRFKYQRTLTTCPNIAYVLVLLPTSVVESHPLCLLSCSFSSVPSLFRDEAQRVITKCEILIAS